MRAGGTGKRERGAAGDADVGARERAGRDADHAPCEVERHDADRDDHDRHEQPPAHELQDRKREEVEADVATEDRIGLSERDLVQPAKQRIPLIAAGDPEEERRNEQEPHDAQGRRQSSAATAVGLDDDAWDLRSKREVQVRERENEEDAREGEERPERGGEAAQVHVLEPEASEPKQIGEEADERAGEQREEEQKNDDDRDDDHPPGRAAHSAAATEAREVEVRPIDASPVPAAAVPAPPAVAHPSQHMAARLTHG